MGFSGQLERSSIGLRDCGEAVLFGGKIGYATGVSIARNSSELERIQRSHVLLSHASVYCAMFEPWLGKPPLEELQFSHRDRAAKRLFGIFLSRCSCSDLPCTQSLQWAFNIAWQHIDIVAPA